MVATVFWIVMLGLGILGIGLIILSIILLKIKDVNGLKAVAIILLILGICGCAAPVGMILYMRMGDAINSKQLDTGVKVVWDSEGSFTYDGVKYVAVELEDDVFWYDVLYDEEREASFNIGEESWENDECDVAYKIESGAGMTIYEILAILYCPETEVEKVQKYYQDDQNYIWYMENENSEARVEIELTDEEKEILENMTEEQYDKSLEYNYDENLEYAYFVKESRDGVVEAIMYLVKKDGVWYWDTEIADDSKEVEDGWAAYAVEMPDELSVKVEEILYQ